MSNQVRPRVLLADDNTRILTALRRLLSPSCEILECVTDGLALLEATSRLKPDVVLLDVRMRDINGLDACYRIKQQAPQTIVIFVTASNDIEIKKKALSLGASAFVLKHLVVNELLGAIQKAMVDDA